MHLTPRLGSHPSFSPESARALHKARNPASIFTTASFVIEALVKMDAGFRALCKARAISGLKNKEWVVDVTRGMKCY